MWETGKNRICDLRQGPAGLVLNDEWESFRIRFAIYYPLKEGVTMRINGDLDSLGAWNKDGPVNMRLGGKPRVLPNGGTGLCWEYEVVVPNKVDFVKYKYSTYDETNDLAVWEREPTRSLKVPVDIEYAEYLLQKKAQGLADTALQLELPVNGVIDKLDVNLVTCINYDRIGEFPIYIGAYPQHEEDIELLAKAGVTAVLNVQTDIDMTHRQVNWPRMQAAYTKHGILGINYPIHDFNSEDLAAKLRKGAEIIQRLVKEGKTVYVHCTAGMGRAPANVISYLVIYQNYALGDACDYVKKYRKAAEPNMYSLKKALATEEGRVEKPVEPQQ